MKVEDGYEFQKLDSTMLDEMYQAKIEKAIEEVAAYLIRYPERLESMKDLDIYDKLKDIDWENACHAQFDSEKKCLVITFPATATIKK